MRGRNWSLGLACFALGLSLAAVEIAEASSAGSLRGPSLFLDQSLLGGNYGFCITSVRALYQKAAARALAAEGNRQRQYRPLCKSREVAGRSDAACGSRDGPKRTSSSIVVIANTLFDVTR